MQPSSRWEFSSNERSEDEEAHPDPDLQDGTVQGTPRHMSSTHHKCLGQSCCCTPDQSCRWWGRCRSRPGRFRRCQPERRSHRTMSCLRGSRTRTKAPVRAPGQPRWSLCQTAPMNELESAAPYPSHLCRLRRCLGRNSCCTPHWRFGGSCCCCHSRRLRPRQCRFSRRSRRTQPRLYHSTPQSSLSDQSVPAPLSRHWHRRECRECHVWHPTHQPANAPDLQHEPAPVVAVHTPLLQSLPLAPPQHTAPSTPLPISTQDPSHTDLPAWQQFTEHGCCVVPRQLCNAPLLRVQRRRPMPSAIPPGTRPTHPLGRPRKCLRLQSCCTAGCWKRCTCC